MILSLEITISLLRTPRCCLLVDPQAGIGCYPLVTTNLAWGEFSKLKEPSKMPTRARRGSVMAVTEIEYGALLRKLSGKP